MGSADWLWQQTTGYSDRPALEAAGATRTYGELVDEADQVAGALCGQLSDTGAVLLLAPRAVPATVVVLLALWRCGMTAVLADAEAPDARIDELLTALPPVAVLRARRPGEPQEAGDVLTLGVAWDLDPHYSPSGFPYGCPDPAYVIATSGSTGTPKLVLCHHTGLRHLSPALAERYGYDSGSRVLQFAPASYDAMIADVVVPLSAGSTLVFEGFGDAPSPALLCDAISGRGITHVTFPPTVLRRLEALDAPRCTVISAGEALDGALAEQLLPRCGRLINAYGPCEATVAATAFDVTVGGSDDIPIGSPLPGVQVGLAPAPDLPAHLPPGSGLISIAGPTVAWGYVADDRLTTPSEPGFSARGRFVTGDVAWRDGQDQLVFAGRIDRQLKRWGHRIEPAAIERRLRGLPGVTDCTVVPDAMQLHAFLVSDEPSDVVTTAARKALPRHELPTHWHLVDALPALASDKVDVAALSAAATAKSATSSLSPTGDVDPRLVSLWERFVGSAADPDIEVFAAGGDSLAAMLLLAAVEEELDVRVDLVEFLQRPTLAGLEAQVAP
jgi:non-ribosomal peptide synthetase component F